MSPNGSVKGATQSSSSSKLKFVEPDLMDRSVCKYAQLAEHVRSRPREIGTATCHSCESVGRSAVLSEGGAPGPGRCGGRRWLYRGGVWARQKSVWRGGGGRIARERPPRASLTSPVASLLKSGDRLLLPPKLHGGRRCARFEPGSERCCGECQRL